MLLWPEGHTSGRAQELALQVITGGNNQPSLQNRFAGPLGMGFSRMKMGTGNRTDNGRGLHKVAV